MVNLSNKNMLSVIIAVMVVSVLLSSLCLAASLDGSESGAGVQGDRRGTGSSLTSDCVNRSEFIQKRCTGCHSQQRIINGVNQWMRLSESEYKEAVSSMITKKIRLTNGELTRQEGHKVYDLLVNLYGRSRS